eukprot:53859-Pelagomonas_calceolata.AAC.3
MQRLAAAQRLAISTRLRLLQRKAHSAGEVDSIELETGNWPTAHVPGQHVNEAKRSVPKTLAAMETLVSPCMIPPCKQPAAYLEHFHCQEQLVLPIPLPWVAGAVMQGSQLFLLGSGFPQGLSMLGKGAWCVQTRSFAPQLTGFLQQGSLQLLQVPGLHARMLLHNCSTPFHQALKFPRSFLVCWLLPCIGVSRHTGW